jgi:hypothetical protein
VFVDFLQIKKCPNLQVDAYSLFRVIRNYAKLQQFSRSATPANPRQPEDIRDYNRLYEQNKLPHNPEVIGSNPVSATIEKSHSHAVCGAFCFCGNVRKPTS